MNELQSIYFMTPEWDSTRARQWLIKHKYKPIKRVHKLGSQLRYRLRNPNKYTKFKTKGIGKGIYFVFGFS